MFKQYLYCKASVMSGSSSKIDVVWRQIMTISAHRSHVLTADALARQLEVGRENIPLRLTTVRVKAASGVLSVLRLLCILERQLGSLRFFRS